MEAGDMEAMLILCTHMIQIIIMNIHGGIGGFHVIGFEKQ